MGGRRPPGPPRSGAGGAARGRTRVVGTGGPALPRSMGAPRSAARARDGSAARSWTAECGLDVLHPVSRRVSVEVERPVGRPLTPAEPRGRGPRQRSQRITMGTAMPVEDLARPSMAPAPVNEAVDLGHVEATHLRRPPLATDHAGRMLFPVDDVSKGVLDRPGIPGRGTGDAPDPVSWAQPCHEAVGAWK